MCKRPKQQWISRRLAIVCYQAIQRDCPPLRPLSKCMSTIRQVYARLFISTISWSQSSANLMSPLLPNPRKQASWITSIHKNSATSLPCNSGQVETAWQWLVSTVHHSARTGIQAWRIARLPTRLTCRLFRGTVPHILNNAARVMGQVLICRLITAKHWGRSTWRSSSIQQHSRLTRSWATQKASSSSLMLSRIFCCRRKIVSDRSSKNYVGPHLASRFKPNLKQFWKIAIHWVLCVKEASSEVRKLRRNLSHRNSQLHYASRKVTYRAHHLRPWVRVQVAVSCLSALSHLVRRKILVVNSSSNSWSWWRVAADCSNSWLSRR